MPNGAARTSRPTSSPSRWPRQRDLRRRKCCRTRIVAGRYRPGARRLRGRSRGQGRSVEQHATHLIVHGTLHLLGYDHHDDADAADMEAREVRALARLGIANPYEVAA